MKTWNRILKILVPALLLAGALGCQPRAPEPAAAPKAEALPGTAAAAAPAVVEPAATNTAPAPTAAVETAAPAPVSTEPPAATPAPSPDEIDRLLELRSVKITLTIDREGDGSRELAAEIDGAGNMRIANTSTGVENNLPEEMYVGFTAVQHELVVIDGQAYRQDGEGGQWASAPGLEDYLERSLRGSEGPGLWMRLAGAAREARGSEDSGAFRAEHFAFSQMIDVDTVTGDLWVDPASGALVGAKIEVPGVLYTHSNGGVHYPVLITLEVVPAEIEPVKLP